MEVIVQTGRVVRSIRGCQQLDPAGWPHYHPVMYTYLLWYIAFLFENVPSLCSNLVEEWNGTFWNVGHYRP